MRTSSLDFATDRLFLAKNDRLDRIRGKRHRLLEQAQPDFGELAVRLAGYGARTFAELGLGGHTAVIGGVGLSIEDFVWKTLADFAEGRLKYHSSKGDLLNLLGTAMRRDIIDALRKRSHEREEARPPVADDKGAGESHKRSLEHFASDGTDLVQIVDEEEYCARVRAAFDDEPELKEVVEAVLDIGALQPREIADVVGVSTDEIQNRKKKLRRRVVERGLVRSVRR